MLNLPNFEANCVNITVWLNFVGKFAKISLINQPERTKPTDLRYVNDKPIVPIIIACKNYVLLCEGAVMKNAPIRLPQT